LVCYSEATKVKGQLRQLYLLMAIAGLALTAALWVVWAAWGPPAQPSVQHPSRQSPIPKTATRRPELAPPATNSNFSVGVPDFAAAVPTPLPGPFDMAQANLGRSTYTQWCATCHGDRGQGLAAWRPAWDEEHRTCSQSGCHGRNHPPDGFALLKDAPALIGPQTLPNYGTLLQLFTYIKATMPYQAKGSLSDEEYLAIAVYLANHHGANASGRVITLAEADSILLPKR
jgi:mono/diheme cytochrome c family protein